MRDDIRLDDELATYTDRVLAGEKAALPPELSELAEVVQQLYRAVAPNAPPLPAFQTQLTQRLTLEWSRQHQRQHVWYRQRPAQLATFAAAVVVVLLLVIVLSTGSSNDSGALQGTSFGSLAWAALIVVGVVLAVAVGVLWYRERR